MKLDPLPLKKEPHVQELLQPAQTSNPLLRGKTGPEIAQAVVDGDVDAQEAGAVLLARAVRKVIS
jgi:hypothetical protein